MTFEEPAARDLRDLEEDEEEAIMLGDCKVERVKSRRVPRRHAVA